jgi:hypothetical protein
MAKQVLATGLRLDKAETTHVPTASLSFAALLSTTTTPAAARARTALPATAARAASAAASASATATTAAGARAALPAAAAAAAAAAARARARARATAPVGSEQPVQREVARVLQARHTRQANYALARPLPVAAGILAQSVPVVLLGLPVPSRVLRILSTVVHRAALGLRRHAD